MIADGTTVSGRVIVGSGVELGPGVTVAAHARICASRPEDAFGDDDEGDEPDGGDGAAGNLGPRAFYYRDEEDDEDDGEDDDEEDDDARRDNKVTHLLLLYLFIFLSPFLRVNFFNKLYLYLCYVE